LSLYEVRRALCFELGAVGQPDFDPVDWVYQGGYIMT
jgi:hypothetical protein